MDKIIKGSKAKKRRRNIVIYSTAAVLFGATLWALGGKGKSHRLDRERIRTSLVIHDTFEDVIPIQGVVEPVKSFYLDAIEGGTVQEVYVEAGADVEAGDPLLKLSNINMMLDFMNRETQIVEQINNLRNTRMQMELNERNIKEQVLDIEQQLDNMQRQFVIDTSLYASEVISQQEYEDSQSRYAYLQKKQKLLVNSFEKDEKYRNLQVVRIDKSIDMMERNLEAIRDNLENLVVKAPISGQLTSLDAEIGESKARGENLGRIDVLEDYIVTANIDEHYINRVRIGQKGNFTTAGASYGVTLQKIFPEVNNNQFQVEFRFEKEKPDGIRRGQSVNMRLALSTSSEALMVSRSSFYSSTGGKWVYVLNADGTGAQKREVTMGRQNPDYIEVLEGLEEGEEIISSSYDTYSDYDNLILK